MDFDLNFWRSVMTVLSLAVFLGVIAWAWSRRRQGEFDEAAHLPFLDADDTPGTSETN